MAPQKGKKKAVEAEAAPAVAGPPEGLSPEELLTLSEELKAKGNAAFTAKDFKTAAEQFSEAIACNANNHVLYSNRSACYASLGDNKKALGDALRCVQLKPEWPKGYSRLATAQLFLNNLPAARTAFKTGLDFDPGNIQFVQGLAEIEEKLETLRLKERAAASAMMDAQRMRQKAELEAANAVEGEEGEERAKVQQAEPEVVIGIDLGTTYSCAGVWRDGAVEIIPNGDGERTTASYVAFTDGGRLVGEAAKRQGPLNPTRTLYNIKRIIGRTCAEAREDIKRMPFKVIEGKEAKPMVEVQVPPNGQTRRFAPEEISAMVLLKIKEDAEIYLGKPVRKAVVTVPAYFNDHQRRLTKDAGAIAGLDVLRIINEPTAAALAYGLDLAAEPEKTVYVLVFDLGGGTFDVSLLAIKDKLFEVKATAGDTHLGGEDFDNALVDWLIEEFKKVHKKDYFGGNTRRSLQLRAACERAKRTLSGAHSSWVELEAEDNTQLRMEVTRDKFEKLNEPLFLRCLDSVKRCLQDAGVKKELVDEVVLVGGSTRIPRVQTMLADFFGGKQLCKSVNPDEAVAFGAAVQGAILAGVRSAATQALLLMDVIPLTLGIETEGKQFAKVVPRNSTVPIRKAQEFTTTEDWQTEVDVCVYEGERTNVAGNHLLGKFAITGIERAKRGVPKVEVVFEINTNGLLLVSARDKTTGASAKIEIAGGAGRLSPEEIERMQKDAERYKEEDELLARQVSEDLAAREAASRAAEEAAQYA